MLDRRLISLLTACLLLALVLLPHVGGTASPRMARPASGAAAPTVSPVEVGGCRTAITRTLSSAEVRTCEQVTVTTRVTSACRGCPGGLHVVFIVISGQLGTARGAGAAVVDELEQFQSASDTKVAAAVVYYWPDSTRVAMPMTERLSQVRGALGGAPRWIGLGGYEDGASVGLGLLQSAAKDSDIRCDIIVFMGKLKEHDGPSWEEFRREMRSAARIMRQDASTLIVYCVDGGDLNCRTMRQLAESPRYYAEAPDTQKLAKAVRERIPSLLVDAPAGLHSLGLDQGLPTGLAYVPDSAAPPLRGLVSDPVTTTLHWQWDGPISRADYTTTYRIAPAAPAGSWLIGAMADVEPIVGRRHQVPVPPVTVNITGPCVPTPTVSSPATPTATSKPSAVPSSTATPVALATPTPTGPPTATVTPVPGPLYVPVALRERCLPSQMRLDVALVVDASTSMGELTTAGRPKIEAARDAVGTFLDELRFDAGDQAAIVVFNREAWVLQRLTTVRHALDVGLAGIALASTTRLDLGVETATTELASDRHRPDNAVVMIVLTDGRANPVGPEVAVERARAAKSAGVTVFTIGVGEDLDLTALESMASKPGYFRRATDAEALAAIYQAIAVEIPCPGDAYWARR